MRHVNLRCPDCWQLYSVRRPSNPNLIPLVVERVRCPLCHPEALADVCAGCRLPFSIAPQHSNGQCGSCVRRLHYWALSEARRITVRLQSLARIRLVRAERTLQTTEETYS